MRRVSDTRTGGWGFGSVYMLMVLALVNAFNYFDRGLLGLLLPLIQADVQLSDTVLGLVSGGAFALFHGLLCVPIARYADYHNRRNVIALGLITWSVATALTGLAQNVMQLVLARFLLGAGAASSIAPANSIATDLCSPAQRPVGVAILGTASSISSILLIPLAGWMSYRYGWRETFLVAGALGIVLAGVLALSTREPTRAAAAEGTQEPRPRFMDSLRQLSRSHTFVMIVLAESLIAVNMHAILVWGSTLLVRTHGLDMVEIGGIMGSLRGVAALSGVILGGYIVTRLARRDERWRLWLPSFAIASILPFQWLFVFSDNMEIALLGLAVLTMMLLIQQPSVFVVCLNLAPPHMKATALSVMLVCSGLIGQSTGPFLVGLLNDVLQPLFHTDAIRYSLAATAICTWPAAVFLFLGAGRLRKGTSGRNGQDLIDERRVKTRP